MKNLLLPLLLGLCTIAYGKDKTFKLESPDKQTEIHIDLTRAVSYSIYSQGRLILDQSQIGLELAGQKTLGVNPKLLKASRNSIHEVIQSPLYRTSNVENKYNELNLKFSDRFGLEFRAYNEGVAYRFYTLFKDSITIVDEIAEFNFDKDYTTYQAYSTNQKNPYASAFQNLYTEAPLSRPKVDNLAFLPITIDYGKELKLTIMESDLEDYPGMFIQGDSTRFSLKGHYALHPKTMKLTPRRYMTVVDSKEGFIAKTKGSRTYPWRILVITERDSDMPVNNLVYALAAPNRIGDASWVKGGLVSWEWWNNWGITKVDFSSGINMDTYKHYIDFASEYGLPYVILDEGWYTPQSGDMLTVIPELKLEELVDYGRSKNVGLILWTVFNVLDDQLDEACSRYSKLGIKGFKVDFLDRDDQEAVQMVYRLAEATAKHKLILNLHGIYKPTGLNRTYPNILNFEGVFGMEEVKWSKVEKDMMKYDVTMPFIRMMAGPLDYTPGAMRNANKSEYRDIYNNPISQGTRCHQLAAYIIHDSPLTMLADNPTIYRQESECTEFISSIPNTGIEETRVLKGELGEYIVTARRVGANWYIGGMTNWTARVLDLDLSFLNSDHYDFTLFKDGVNADKNATDYKKERGVLNNQSTITIQLAPGGGFAIKLIKQ